MANKMKMITIPKQEYLELRRLRSMIDEDLLGKLIKGFEDVKEGRVTRVR